MIIEKRRINSINKYFANISEDKEVYVAVSANENNLGMLMMEGSPDGTCVVPEPIGPVTRYNLYGKELVHIDREKESREIERSFHIIDWHGADHYGTCFQSRMCYPKDYIDPPLIRIILDNGKLRSNLLTKANAELLKHTINVFLEVFGRCEIIDKDENPIGQMTRIKEVSWRILPPGKYPWDRAEKELNEYFEKVPVKNKEVLRNNHKTFAKYEPDFLAIGVNSFNGYVVYGYTDRNLYVFESNQPGNATYIFIGDWENASKLTKYDIIKGNLCYNRIVHSKLWEEKVKQVFDLVLKPI